MEPARVSSPQVDLTRCGLDKTPTLLFLDKDLGLAGVSMHCVFCFSFLRRDFRVKPAHNQEAHTLWVSAGLLSLDAGNPLDRSPPGLWVTEHSSVDQVLV